MNTKKNNWSLRNIILMTLIAIICGAIFWAIGFLQAGISALLAPFGLSIMSLDIAQGPWILAAPLIGFLFRIPGFSFVGQLIAAVIEMFIGDQYGATDILSGIVDGAGFEIGFFLMGYKHYNQYTLLLTSFLTTITTYIYSWFIDGYSNLPLKLLIPFFIVRFISIFVFSELAYVIERMIKRAVKF